MPLYEYLCTACGRLTEKRQKFSDPEITDCPHCGGHLERTITAPAIQFKGGGWYADLYSKGKKPTASNAGGESNSGSEGGTAGESGQSAEAAKTGGEAGKSGGDAGKSGSESKSSDTSSTAAPATSKPAPSQVPSSAPAKT